MLCVTPRTVADRIVHAYNRCERLSDLRLKTPVQGQPEAVPKSASHFG